MIAQEVKTLEVKKAEYISDYRIKLIFNDGKEQVVDFESFLRRSKHPEIRKYLNLDMFRQYYLEHGDLIWNDYDLCFPIADLYSGKI